MKRKRKLQKKHAKEIAFVNQLAKIFLNSEYGWLYNDTDSVTSEEAQYVAQDNVVIRDFFKKQEV